MSDTQKPNNNIRVDLRALITDPEHKILLIKSNPSSNWDLPGGLVDINGTWAESLENTIADQLELQIMTNQPIYADDYKDPASGDYTFMVIVDCQIFQPSSGQKTSEHFEIKWFSIEELEGLNFATYAIQDCIKQLL